MSVQRGEVSPHWGWLPTCRCSGATLDWGAGHSQGQDGYQPPPACDLAGAAASPGHALEVSVQLKNRGGPSGLSETGDQVHPPGPGVPGRLARAGGGGRSESWLQPGPEPDCRPGGSLLSELAAALSRQSGQEEKKAGHTDFKNSPFC